MAGRKAQRAFGPAGQARPIDPQLEAELEACEASIWRVVEAGLFTLTELGTTVPYPYFVKAHRYLDVKQRIESAEYERVKRESKR